MTGHSDDVVGIERRRSIGELIEPLRQSFGRDTGVVVRGRRLTVVGLLTIAAVVLVAALLTAVTVSQSIASKTATSTSLGVHAPVDLNDPLVVMAPSNGRNGAPLVLVAGKPLFPLSTGGVFASTYEAPIEAQSVRVQAIAGSRGIWVGQSPEQRVYVEIPGSAVDNGSLAADTLRIGEVVNLSGRVKPPPQDLAALGVVDASEVEQLTEQGGLIYANSVRPAST